MVVVVSISSSQELVGESEHMTFKGVPIDGTLNDYVNKMKKSGFDHIATEDGVAILTGDFAGYKDCTIGVVTLKPRNLVSKITVIFPYINTWSNLASNYYFLQELLTEKYGEPSEVLEKFDTYSKPEDDEDRMYAVKMDNCKYYTTYETDKGRIQLTIDHESVVSCFVRLSYYDKVNGKILREKAKGDL